LSATPREPCGSSAAVGFHHFFDGLDDDAIGTDIAVRTAVQALWTTPEN